MSVVNIKYKDGRDETIVYAGLKSIGRILRIEGGWVYKPENCEDVSGLPVFVSRQRVKESMTFKNS